MTKHKTDTQLQEDVLRELKGDTRVSVTDIGVTVKSGVVTLTGEVDSWARRSLVDFGVRHPHPRGVNLPLRRNATSHIKL